jgi:hypothetical protein
MFMRFFAKRIRFITHSSTPTQATVEQKPYTSSVIYFGIISEGRIRQDMCGEKRNFNSTRVHCKKRLTIFPFFARTETAGTRNICFNCMDPHIKGRVRHCNIYCYVFNQDSYMLKPALILSQEFQRKETESVAENIWFLSLFKTCIPVIYISITI